MSEKKKGTLHVEYYSAIMKNCPARAEYGIFYREVGHNKYAVWAQKVQQNSLPGSMRMATLKKIHENPQESETNDRS